MTKDNNIASFMLRFTQELWSDQADEPHVRWRGHVRHVQSDEQARFTDFAEAVAFIQQHLAELTAETLEGGKNMNQEKVFQENFKIWEQFANTYTDLMFGAMRQTVKQSEALKEQVDEARNQALKMWGFEGKSEDGEVLEVLKDIREQLRMLNERVEALEQGRGGAENE